MNDENKKEFYSKYYISSFIKHINTMNYSIYTVNSYLNDLFYFYLFIKKDLFLVNEDDIRKYISFMSKDNKKASSINRTLSTFKTFFKFLCNEKIIDKKDYPLNKISYLKREKNLPKFLYSNELEEIINESSNDNDNLRDKLLIELLYATGVRISELVNIKICDIDFSNKRIVVLGKGNKERVVYYGDYASDALKEYLNGRSNKNEYVFLNHRNEKISESGCRYIIDNIMKRLAIKTHVTPHVLRHTFATNMLNNGCDIKIVSELLGHTSLKSTEIYTHVTNEKIKEVYYNSFKRRED